MKPDCGRAARASSIITATGVRWASSGSTGKPVRTDTFESGVGVGKGVGVGTGVGLGDGVGGAGVGTAATGGDGVTAAAGVHAPASRPISSTIARAATGE